MNLTLSGQLASQFSVIESAAGYGLGWTDEEKVNRALAFESKYGKKIWALTDDEKNMAIAMAQKITNDAFSA